MSDEQIQKYEDELKRLDAAIEQLHRERSQAKYALIVGLPLAAVAFSWKTLVGWVTLITVVTAWCVALYLVWVYMEDRRFHRGKVEKELGTFRKRAAAEKGASATEPAPAASETLATDAPTTTP